MYQKILVPTDGSRSAWRAMQAAAGLARLSGADVIVMHVIAPPVVVSGCDLPVLVIH